MNMTPRTMETYHGNRAKKPRNVRLNFTGKNLKALVRVMHGFYLMQRITIGKPSCKYPANVIRNQKYNLFTFLPLVFYQQVRVDW